jgi:DNA-binding CsgD family transcriptional regulator
MGRPRLLEGLGITAAEESAYRALLRHGPATLNELAAGTGASTATARRLLPRLEDLGLVSRVAGRPLRLVATPPEVAVDVLTARRQEEIARSRSAAGVLAAEIAGRSRAQPEEVLEVVTGKEAVGRRFLQLERDAAEETLILVRPPYPPGDGGEERGAARRRAIYGPLAFQEPGMLERTRRAIAEGEDARLGQVPVKLAVAANRTAIMPLAGGEDAAVESALVVHPSALLDALVELFEVLWRAGTPLTAATVTGPADVQPAEDAPDDDVLVLLAAGMKDEAIARHLGLSARTVQRRVHSLCDRLGARTRFHAGLLAARLLAVPGHSPGRGT